MSLIVDFPQEHLNSDNGNAARAFRKKRKVHFSTVETCFFERCDKLDKSKVWYSDEDHKTMKRANKQDVMSIRRACLSMASGDLEQCDATGVENLLTPNLIKKTRAARAKIWSAVLDEQERQFALGEYDPIKIAMASIRISEWSARRAQKIGLYQSK